MSETKVKVKVKVKAASLQSAMKQLAKLRTEAQDGAQDEGTE